MKRIANTPTWVWLIIVGLSAIEPVLHIWIANFPPEGAVHSGLHTVDTQAYRSAMIHYADDFYSPYSACDSVNNGHDVSFYAIPHHHLYGVLGILGRILHVPGFLFLGASNGVCLAFFLVSAYVLLRVVVPNVANLSFLFFTLGGGLGGVLYVVTGMLGLHDNANFADNFLRFFLYELCEGARFQPHLLMARLYYTSSLGVAFVGLASLATALKKNRMKLLVIAAQLQFLCTFLNFRVGPMILGVACLYLLCETEANRRIRILAAALFSGSTFLAVAVALKLLALNPVITESVFASLSGTMWLAPFLSATALYWLLVPGTIVRSIDTLPPLVRYGGYALIGYALSFITLYLAYQGYWGNVLRGGDLSAAIFISDWALLGLLGGVLFARWKKANFAHPNDRVISWVALWFLLFFVAAVAAFGQGWYAQFMPQRFIVVLGLPLAILCASGYRRCATQRPRVARVLGGALVVCGMTSIAVTWLVVHGPFGYNTAQKYFPWTHFAYISEADGTVLGHVEEGVFLAPSLGHPLFGDVVALRPGARVVYGIGTMDYSHQNMPKLRSRVNEFYQPSTPQAERGALLDRYCVDFVYCPDTDPIDPATIEEFRQWPRLEEIASEDNAVLFRVKKAPS